MLSLSWTNPADADFKGVMLRYRTDGIYPTSKTDGILAVDRPGVTGATEHFDHLSLVNGVTYYYSAFTYDTALELFQHGTHSSDTRGSLDLHRCRPIGVPLAAVL